jgi:N-methylhydantoinase A
MIIGADVGGTFTDLVAVDAGVVSTAKVPTSPNQSDAVATAATRLAGGHRLDALVHGTTVATNTLLEGTGARTVLLTDEGFEDVIEIGRQDRPALYDSRSDRAPPLVARHDRIGTRGAIPPGALEGAEAVAVALIDGHLDHGREDRLAALVEEEVRGIPVSRSSVVAPEFREFERIATTVLNAYLMPVTGAYLRALDERIVGSGVAAGLSVMRSSGGVMSVADASALPVAVLLSGPAGGVVAARAVADRLAMPTVVSFDMGGTSTDVCLIGDGEVGVSYERMVAGYTCRMPSVGIHTVGAGGGSIAWVDAGGSLRVGPRSAGATPGPACYGAGGLDPTVTDANVVLGRVDPSLRLGGTVAIDVDAARRSVATVAHPLGLTIERAALGIVRIADEVMAGAVRTVSVDEGADPSAARLLAFGGAGGLHATSVARSLGMAGVVIPVHAGVFSALGLVLAPPRADAARAVVILDGDLTEARRAATGLIATTRGEIEDAGHVIDRTELHLDVRYAGQAHEIAVPWHQEDGIGEVVGRFGRLHLGRYGFDRGADPIEIVAVRATSLGFAPLHDTPSPEPRSGAMTRSTRPVIIASGDTAAATVVHRQSLSAGDVVAGPAIIEESEATTFLDIGESGVVAEDGSLVVSW